MRKFLIGAVSISALMFAAACGDSNNTYQTSDADAVEEDSERATAMEIDDMAGASDASDAKSWDSENYVDIEDRSPNDRLAANRKDAAEEEASGAQTAQASKSRADIEALAGEAFDSADANDDGAIDREEYVQLALASARDFDGFMTEPANLMQVNPATDPEAVAEERETPGADAQAELQAQAAKTEPVLDDAEAATIETAAAQTFEDAAGEDGELTAEELRTAFLSRFAAADADGDEELDGAELQTFAALTRGEEIVPAEETN